jgi:hypothetical protein
LSPEGYLTLAELATYSRISDRQLSRYLNRPVDPLPHIMNGRRPLILRSAYDEWAARALAPAPLRKPLARNRFHTVPGRGRWWGRPGTRLSNQ